jgi:hypothetical protein
MPEEDEVSQGCRFFEGGFPREWKGSVFRTDFRVWLKREFVSSKKDLSESEKGELSVRLCYESVSPGADGAELARGIEWFGGCGESDRIGLLDLNEKILEDLEIERGKADSKPSLFSFFWDFKEIWASFRGAYGIDLYREELHWWAFNGLMAGLNSDSPVGKLIRSREYDPVNDMKDRAKVLTTKVRAIPKV